MSGLIKPLTQRGRPVASRRNPAINTNKGGIICGNRNASLFISSYHEDKEKKRREQTKERMKQWLMWGFFAVVVFAAVRDSKSNGDVPTSNEASLRIRTQVTNDIIDKKPEVVVAPAAPADPPFKLKSVNCPIDDSGTTSTIAKGSDNMICGRKIGINLSDQAKWPTPFTQSLYKNVKDVSKKEAVLLKKDGPYGSLGCQLNSFFHAYDIAFEKNRPLFVTQDSWALDTLFPLFFGPYSAVEKNPELWDVIRETLEVGTVESEEGLKEMYVDPEYKNPTSLYFTHSTNHDATKIRDHRNTIIRQLFKYPSQLGGKGEKNVCSTIDSVVGEEKNKKYTVIHPGQPLVEKWLNQLNQSSGKDHRAASEMKPEYVQNILKSVDMLQHDIYLTDSSTSVSQSEQKDKLGKAPDLADHIKEVNCGLAGKVYLAVLADVFLGNPVDQTSLWIARMRFALGMGKNTFVFTEKKGDQWVSSLDETNYLDLYDAKKLGTPWMG